MTCTPDERPRLLSETDCHDIAERFTRFASGGGYTLVAIVGTWRGNVRWARNLVSTSGEVRDDHVVVSRDLRGAINRCVEVNDLSDAALVAAARRAERIARLAPEVPDYDFVTHYLPEPQTNPQLFSNTTFQLDASERAAAARHLAQSAAATGMLSAGYIEVTARSHALITSWGMSRYYRYTSAQYSVTVRDPQGTGSGWAGVDWPDWTKIDGPHLSATALEKCRASRNPVAVEPGRYTTILEPQAVCDFVSNLMDVLGIHGNVFQRTNTIGLPNGKALKTEFGTRVLDERITIRSDPLDPELGFPPFRIQRYPTNGGSTLKLDAEVYHPVTWIERGVIQHLGYMRGEGFDEFGRGEGLPVSGAFRMSGGDTSIANMVAATKRGLLVTRFDRVEQLNSLSVLCRGYTRDGVWLVENGKITKAVKNLMFTESVLFALNNVEDLGPPQRTFHPPSDASAWHENPAPVIVPPLRIRDFSFTALSDAV